MVVDRRWSIYCHVVDGPRQEGRVMGYLSQIRDVLYPGGDMDHEWSPSTLEQIAAVIAEWEQACCGDE